jgi:NADH-quinone oxidoreductase subunit H
MTRPAFAAAPILLVLAVAFACLFERGRPYREGDGAMPETVRVRDLVPRDLEIGDRMAILGDGFPPGKQARVTFRGTLHRPGEQPVEGAEILVSATVQAPERIELSIDEPTQALFCGTGPRATHATFEGAVEVAFPASAPGAAPIVGVLEHTTIDVRPGAGASLRDREGEGQRVLAWIGVDAAVAAPGLIIEKVRPGSPAQAAGIAVGEVVTTFDGVHVGSMADVVPPPGERAVTIGIRAARSASPAARVVRIDGLRRQAAADGSFAVLIVFAALLFAWLFGAPAGPTVSAALQRIIARVRAARATKSATQRETSAPFGSAVIVDIVVWAMLGVLPFGPSTVAARFDVGLVFVAVATSLASAAFFARRSVWAGARAFVHVAWEQLPAAASVACVVLATGSLRIREIEDAQGGWPWEWLAFRSPAELLALGLLLGCSQDRTSPASPGRGLDALLEAHGAEAREGRSPWLAAAFRAHRLIVAGLASALFLGGWLLPGISAAQQDGRPLLELAGAAWFLAKTGLVAGLMAQTRWFSPRWSRAERSLHGALWAGPLLSVVVLAATAAWTSWGPSPAGQLLASASLITAFALIAVALTQRVRHGLTSATGNGRLSPFL